LSKAILWQKVIIWYMYWLQFRDFWTWKVHIVRFVDSNSNLCKTLLSHFGTVKDEFWSVLVDFLIVLGDIWIVLGDLWTVLGDLWTVLGDLWTVLGDFCSIGRFMASTERFSESIGLFLTAVGGFWIVLGDYEIVLDDFFLQPVWWHWILKSGWKASVLLSRDLNGFKTVFKCESWRNPALKRRWKKFATFFSAKKCCLKLNKNSFHALKNNTYWRVLSRPILKLTK
jgi:hypothetical protein